MGRLLRHLAGLPGILPLWRRLPVGAVKTRVDYGIWRRPAYAYGVYWAALQAKQLGLPGITAIELGVAGGNGLLALEEHARHIAESLSVDIDVVGFDGGGGMPPPEDHRDLPHVWGRGYYAMDEEALRSRLSSARLVVGPVEQTVAATLPDLRLPVGFAAFDLDYYSSTVDALRLFSGDHATRLPRTYCYFDDTIFPEHALHCEWIGELAAINDFNAQSADRKIAPIANLRHIRAVPESWNEQMYALHDFTHPLYRQNLTATTRAARQKPLTPAGLRTAAAK